MAGIEGLIPVQQAFNGGEVSQLVSARIEQPRFQAGCKTMLNCYPMAQGPATRRPGFRYLGEVKEADKPVRLFPFVFSAEQARVLEFGVGYVRFWTPTGYIVREGKPYEVATPYTENDIPTIDIAQSADIIYIASENHPPAKLSRFGDTDWRYEVIQWTPSIAPPSIAEAVPIGTIPEGEKSRTNYVYVATAVDKETGDESFPSKEVTVYNAAPLSQSYYIRIKIVPTERATEYRIYKKRGGVFGFIGRLIDTGGVVTKPSVLKVSMPEKPKLPFGTYYIDVTLTEFTNPLTFQWLSSSGWKNVPEISGEQIAPRAIKRNGANWQLVSGIRSDEDDGWDPGDIFRVIDATGIPVQITLPEWNTSATVNRGPGIYLNNMFEDRNIQADTADGPPVEKVPFKEEGNYPRKVFLWQQRLGWASTDKRPLTIWMSRTANYENLSAASPPKDDDGIEVTLASESQDRIAWLMGENSLLMGTTGAEYTITGADGGSALTPTSFSFSKQSNFGSEEIGAIFAAGKVLYAQRTTCEVREFGYNFEQDRYISPSMLILATHLIENNKIIEWEWQQSESLLWCVMEDGTLIACTYMMEHEVIGWHKHTTDGKVLHVCCIPGERKDLLFAVIEREISGVKKKYIEMLIPPFVGSNLKDAFFVDCGATYDGEETSRICGLDYLEGKEVSIFCDGASMPSRIVKNGCIDLDYPVKWAHIGLPYYTLLIPNRPEVATEQGAPQGRIINIPKALVRFYRSMNVRVGSEGRKCDDVIKHLSADPVNPQLMSGDVDVAVMGGWSSSRSIQVEVSDPVPMTVVCIIYGLKISPSI